MYYTSCIYDSRKNTHLFHHLSKLHNKNYLSLYGYNDRILDHSNRMLFNNTRKKKSHLHYGSPAAARKTLKYLRKRPRGEQIQGAQAMYFRAKYHAHQTKDMRAAMKVYKKFLKISSLKPSK